MSGEVKKIKPGARVWNSRLGEGTVVERGIDPYSKVDYEAYEIATVIFDNLPEGYSNPFIIDYMYLKLI